MLWTAEQVYSVAQQYQGTCTNGTISAEDRVDRQVSELRKRRTRRHIIQDRDGLRWQRISNRGLQAL